MKKTLFIFLYFLSIQINNAQSSRFTKCEVKSETQTFNGLTKDYNDLSVSDGLFLLVEGEEREVLPSLYLSVTVGNDEFYSFKLNNDNYAFLKYENRNNNNNAELYSHRYNSAVVNHDAMIEEELTIDYYVYINNSLKLLTKENFIEELSNISDSKNINKDMVYFEIPKYFNEL